MKITLEGVSAAHPAALRGAPGALCELSLAIAAGEQVAVIGPSGAGKTTLLQLLACALRLSAGTLALDGADPWTLSPAALRARRASLFLAPQVPPLPPRQRVVTAVLAGRLPNMGVWRSLRSLLKPADAPLAHAALARFDLESKLWARVDRLSGGERQRVGLARALVSDAKLFLVDEPLSALDPARAAQAIATLTADARERDATLVVTLHDVQAALAHFPRIVALRDGALVFDLPAAEVSPARLAALYAQHEDELLLPPVAHDPAGDGAAAPLVVDSAPHCR